jgi:hypothetical protein
VATLLGALIAQLLGGAATRAQTAAAFRDAQEAYLRGQYEDVIGALAPLLEGSQILIEDEIMMQEARKLLGASYVLVGDEAHGADVFRELLRYVRNNSTARAFERYQLDAAQYRDDVLRVFSRVHRELVAELREEQSARERRAAEAEERRRQAQLDLLALAQEAEVEVERDPAPTFVPFGAGQFYNGNEDLGWGLLISEGALLGLSLVSAIVGTSIYYSVPRDERGTILWTDQTQASAEGAAFTAAAAGGAFVSLALIGVVEAVIHFVPRRTERQRREIPDEILRELDLAVGPGGVVLRGRF